MNDLASTSLRSAGVSIPLPGCAETRWYAAYTCANHEKRIAEQFHLRGVEFFLPVYDTVRRWKDRRVRMQFPLFPGYVFVHAPLAHQLRIVQVPGVVRLVGFGPVPTPLPDEQIETLRRALDLKVGTAPHPYLKVGRRVKIISGSLAGLTGILLRNKNGDRVVLSIELIMRSVAVEVDVADIEPIV
jgi:transcription termination/antitermination protein NusG